MKRVDKYYSLFFPRVVTEPITSFHVDYSGGPVYNFIIMVYILHGEL